MAQILNGLSKLESASGIAISQTPTVTAGLYAANDAVGGLLTFANAGRASAEGSILIDVLIIDDAGQDAELELWLFDRTFTAIADNAAWAPTEADLENCIAVVSTSGSTWRAAGTPSVVNVECTREVRDALASLIAEKNVSKPQWQIVTEALNLFLEDFAFVTPDEDIAVRARAARLAAEGK